MRQNLTMLLFFFGTLVSYLSSAWSGITAQTRSSGTPTQEVSLLGPAPEHLLLTLGLALCCVVGMIMMVKSSWMGTARGGRIKTEKKRKERRAKRDKNNRRNSPLFTKKKRKHRWPDSPVHGGDSSPLPPPKDQIPLDPDDDDDDDDKQLPPPKDQIPLPLPDDDKGALPPGDAPALPAAAMEAFKSGSKKPSLDLIEAWVKKHFSSPLNARSPLPWDDYVYPPTPEVPEGVLATYDRVEWLTNKLKEWANKPKRDRKKEDPPDDRLLPAFVGVQNPGAAGLRDSLRDLTGPTPLEMLQAYLDEAGIRYFKAYELCRHNWFKTSVHRKQIPEKFRDAQGRRAAGWGCVLDVLKPNNRFVFALPTFIVPNPRLWPNIIPVLRIVDRFRHWHGKPCPGVSGYRHPWYNKAIGGSQPRYKGDKLVRPGSYHMDFAAFDFSYGQNNKQGDIDAVIFRRFFWALYRIEGSGMGAYRSFIHVDYDRKRHKVPGKFLRWIHRKRKNHGDVFIERFNYVG